MLPAASSVTPGISLLPRTRGPMPERNNKLPTRFACGNAPTGSGARELSNDLLINCDLARRSPRFTKIILKLGALGVLSGRRAKSFLIFFKLRQLRIHLIPRLRVGCPDMHLWFKQARIVQARSENTLSLVTNTAEKAGAAVGTKAAFVVTAGLAGSLIIAR